MALRVPVHEYYKNDDASYEDESYYETDEEESSEDESKYRHSNVIRMHQHDLAVPMHERTIRKRAEREYRGIREAEKLDRARIVIKKDKRGRKKFEEHDFEEDRLVVRRRDRSLLPLEEITKKGALKGSRFLGQDSEEDEVVIRRRNRSLPPRENYERHEFVMRHRKRNDDSTSSDEEISNIIARHVDSTRLQDYRRKGVRFRFHSNHRHSRSRSRNRADKQEIIIKNKEQERRYGTSDVESDEILIRKRIERRSSRSPERVAYFADTPVVRVSPARRLRNTNHKSLKGRADEIEVRQRDENNERTYDRDIVIDRRGREYLAPQKEELILLRARSKSRERETDLVVRECEQGRRTAEHGHIGEAYKGVTDDWTIIDVPPGTKRVTMEGVGGANQEISWSRYDGSRQARLIPEGEQPGHTQEVVDQSPRRVVRRYAGAKDKRGDLWTELTKDLIVKEAMEKLGYEFEETQHSYYIFKYLGADDVTALVNLSEEIRHARRQRIHAIHRDRSPSLLLPAPPPPPPLSRPPAPLIIEKSIAPSPPLWEERIRERDFVIEEGRRLHHGSHGRK